MRKTTSILFFVVLVLLVIIVTDPFKVMSKKVSPLLIGTGEAKARRFGLIIDVRTPEQRQVLGYYPNSIPISLEKLDMEVPLDISNKNTWILVYSNGDEKAQYAAEKLYIAGYPNVRYIQGTYLSLMPGSN